nr:EOG090X0439 [Eulimnadia texana]
MVVLYRCICSRHYAEWRSNWWSSGGVTPQEYYSQVIAESMPLVLDGHRSPVECVATDGHVVSSVCLSGQLRVWDVQTGECISYVDRYGFADSPRQPSSPRGSYAQDIGELSTSPLSYSCSPPLGFRIPRSPELSSRVTGSPVWCMQCFEGLVALGCANGQIELWAGNVLKCLYDDSSGVGVAKLKAVGDRLLAARLSGVLECFQIQVMPPANTSPKEDSSPPVHADKFQWDAAFRLVRVCGTRAHQQPIIVLDSEGGRVVSGSQDHCVKVWRLDNLMGLFTLHGHCGPITALFIDSSCPSASGTGSQDGMLCLWDLGSGTCVYSLQAHDGSVVALTYASSRQRHLRLWKPVVLTMERSKRNLPKRVGQQLLQMIGCDNPDGDPLGEMLRHYDGDAAAANRTVLTADSVTQDDRGIRQLIQVGFFRAAINLCGRLLTAYGQGSSRPAQVTKHTPHSLQLWFTRLALLVKTEQFGVAETEAAAFGDLNSADLLFQFYPELYGNRKGSMVPFGMRLLLAQLPSLVGRISETQQKLHQILRTVRQILQNIDTFAGDKNSPTDLETARKLWESRERTVNHYLINSTILQRDYRSAIRLLQQQLEVPAESKASLLSVLGRVYLQFGDVKSAQAAFHQAADLRDKCLPADNVASLVDAALVAIAQNAFTEAHRLLEQALLLDPQNPLVINNKAVCLLYMGQMQQAMQYLEESIGTKPDLMLLDPTVVNVCTLYELETSLTMQRKLGMLRLASQWRSDSFSVHNFKLQL